MCKYCGSQGIHVKCGDLPLTEDVKWKCSFCTDVVKKIPPKAKHHLTKIKKMKKGKSSQRSLNAKILSRTSFRLEALDVCLMKSQTVTASVKLCPNYEVPLPINLGRLKPTVQAPEEIVKKAVERVAKLENVNLSPMLKLSPVKKNTPSKYYGLNREDRAMTPTSPYNLTPTKQTPVKNYSISSKVSPKKLLKILNKKMFGLGGKDSENETTGDEQSEPENEEFKCDCGTEYVTKTSLKMHQMNCDKVTKIIKFSPKKRTFSEAFSEENDSEPNNVLQESCFELEPVSGKVPDQLFEESSEKRKEMAKKKCESCQELITVVGFKNHFKVCSLFYKFMKRNSYEFECRICSKQTAGLETKDRSFMYSHIRDKHQENLDSTENVQKIDNLEPNISTFEPSKDHENLQKQDPPEQKKPKKECRNCYKWISDSGFTKHITSCNLKHQESLNSSENSVEKSELMQENGSQQNQGGSSEKKMAKCEYCQESVFLTSKHTNSCKIYYKFMKKSSDVYQCQLCSFEASMRYNMYQHIKSKHQKSLDCEPENSDLGPKNSEKNGQENSTLSPSTSSSPDSTKENNNQLNRNSPKSPDKRNNKKKCENCQEFIGMNLFSKHSQKCKLYFKFMQKNPDGFQCQLCPSQAKIRANMNAHIRDKHPECLNSDSEMKTPQSKNKTNPHADENTSMTSSPTSSKKKKKQEKNEIKTTPDGMKQKSILNFFKKGNTTL